MMRLFVALSLPVDVRARLAALQTGLAGARWIDAPRMHLTLRFIGEVPEVDARDMDFALQGIHAPAFDVTLDGVGYFERRGLVHAVWARIARNEALSHLQAKVESAMVRCGLEPEGRKFTPHITLARLKDVPAHNIGPWMQHAHGVGAPVGSSSFHVDGFVLYQSFRSRNGAKYEPLAEYPLLEPIEGASETRTG